MREAAGTQSSMIYIGRRQATVAQWIALRPIFEVFAGEIGYKWGGFRREAWWFQGMAYKQLWATLEEILREARSRRRQEGRVTQ